MGTAKKLRTTSVAMRPPAPARPLIDEAFIHLTARNHTTESLAEALGVSKATAFRAVRALRAQGLKVESVKRGREWYFEVDDEKELELSWKRDPFRRLIGFVRGRKRARGVTVDDLVYRKK